MGGQREEHKLTADAFAFNQDGQLVIKDQHIAEIFRRQQEVAATSPDGNPQTDFSIGVVIEIM